MQAWPCKEEQGQIFAVEAWRPYTRCICSLEERQQYAAGATWDLDSTVRMLCTAMDFQRMAGPIGEAAVRQLVQNIEQQPLDVRAERQAFSRLPGIPQALHMLHPVRPSFPSAPCWQACADQLL